MAADVEIDPKTQAIIKTMFAALGPSLGDILERVALTPDKLREAMKPYEDPAKIARELRERENNRKQFMEGRKADEERRRRCPHRDKEQKYAINLQHNFYDAKPRGICPICHDVIAPEHWDVDSKGKAFVVPAHPLYHIVEMLDSQA